MQYLGLSHQLRSPAHHYERFVCQEYACVSQWLKSASFQGRSATLPLPHQCCFCHPPRSGRGFTTHSPGRSELPSHCSGRLRQEEPRQLASSARTVSEKGELGDVAQLRGPGCSPQSRGRRTEGGVKLKLPFTVQFVQVHETALKT